MSEFIDGNTLGSGGFGEVCVCTNGGNRFAKKKLLPTATPDAERRFQREVRILSKLDHPNIVKIVAQKLTDKPYWYVMPLYKGSVQDELPILTGNEDRIKKLFKAILDGIGYAHKEGVVHRDLKPANVLMNNDDDLAVSDFGLGLMTDAEATRHTMSGIGMGTFFYVSPEQVRDFKRADQRSDIFALGRILYVLHTGPLTSPTPNLARVPSNIRVIISKCTHDEPDRRFQTVAEMKQAWLTAIGEFIVASASDRASALIQEFVTDTSSIDGSKVDEIADLLLQHQDDSDFVHNTVMKVPTEVFVLMARGRLDDAKAILRRFSDVTAKESYGFSYTDDLGNKCVSLYRTMQDFEIRADILFCIMEVGYDHNRYAVMEQFKTLMESDKQPGEGLAVVERLKDASPLRLKEIKNHLSLPNLDPTIRDFIVQNTAESGEAAF